MDHCIHKHFCCGSHHSYSSADPGSSDYCCSAHGRTYATRSLMSISKITQEEGVPWGIFILWDVWTVYLVMSDTAKSVGCSRGVGSSQISYAPLTRFTFQLFFYLILYFFYLQMVHLQHTFLSIQERWTTSLTESLPVNSHKLWNLSWAWRT